jgi:hypothetical protein
MTSPHRRVVPPDKARPLRELQGQPRYDYCRKLWTEGYTVREIAAAAGIAHQRVQAMIKFAGGTPGRQLTNEEAGELKRLGTIFLAERGNPAQLRPVIAKLVTLLQAANQRRVSRKTMAEISGISKSTIVRLIDDSYKPEPPHVSLEDAARMRTLQPLATQVRATTRPGHPNRRAGEELDALLRKWHDRGTTTAELAALLGVDSGAVHNRLNRHNRH